MPMLGTRGAASARGFGAFASLGSQYWMGTLGSTGNGDLGYAVAFDSLGSVYLAGLFGGGGLELVKYSSTGLIQWQRKLGGISNNDVAYGVAIDSSNNVYIVGTHFITSTYDIVLAKYNSSGTIQWQRRLTGGGGGQGDAGYAIAVDSSSNIYVCGESNNSGSPDIQIAKYDSSGTIQWQRRLDSVAYSINGDDRGYGIAVDTSGNVYIGGIASNAASTFDGCITKYNSTGTIQWQRTLNVTSQNTYVYAIAVDSSGNPYITGQWRDAGTNELFVIKYDTSGTLQWQRSLGGSGTGDQDGKGIAVDSSSNVYVCGSSSNATVDFQIAKYNTSGTIQWQRSLSSSISDFGENIAVDSSNNMYIIGSSNVSTSGYDFLFSKLPDDGSKTGTYTVGGYSFTYASTSLTDAAATLTSSASSLTDSASTLTDAASSLTDAATTLTSSVTAIP